ncbi:MAG TPA: PEP-CTERM sorting domain-containing protein, partial [Fimbriimonadaceae bacterium]|nr:PEP-CTERM sorting domain-containing protein [Fimbriimonadaceae bacterium]
YEGYLAPGFGTNPIGLSIDPGGVLDVYFGGNNAAYKFDAASGNYMGSIAGGYAKSGFGVVSDQNSVEYLADFTGGTVYRFDNRTGAYMGQLGSGFLTNPTFLAVTPAPEPASLAVLLGGSIAVLMRRRARKTP